MSKLIARSLEYCLFPGKIQPHFPHWKDYEEVYRFWRDFWSNVFGELQPSHTVRADDLYRQDYIAVLRFKGAPIGIHAYTLFDLRGESSFDHSYFKGYYPPAFNEELKRREFRSVMTMEFFGVSPQWRSQNVGVSLAAVLVGAGLNLAKHAGADAVVTVARKDVGATHLAQSYGAESIFADVTMYNVLCDLMIFELKKVTPYPKPQVNELVDHFWKNRIDYAEKPAFQSKPSKKAA